MTRTELAEVNTGRTGGDSWREADPAEGPASLPVSQGNEEAAETLRKN